jgi:Spy/CpxP family protein refolding chaperone
MTVTQRGVFPARLLAALVIGWPVNTAFAQVVVISGTVRSAQGQRLPAEVRVENMNAVDLTDSAGFYRLTLPADRARGQTAWLTVRAIGYRSQAMEITLATRTHNFILVPEPTRSSNATARGTMDTVRTNTVRGDGPQAFDTVRTNTNRERQLGIDTVRSSKQLAFTVDKGSNVVTPANSDFSQHLFPPELIMQNQGRLRITESQREAILQEIYKVQATAAQVQWRVSDESEKLNALLERENVSEAQVLEQARQMIMFETAVKQAQLSMLIRVRNLLTLEQRETLKSLRRRDE